MTLQHYFAYLLLCAPLNLLVLLTALSWICSLREHLVAQAITLLCGNVLIFWFWGVVKLLETT